uniref:Uncharacterized protein n=1 Tax=Kalanchoe fedtschenkoi TaxID=63787 RepID=A0A7N0SW39_KALFE
MSNPDIFTSSTLLDFWGCAQAKRPAPRTTTPPPETPRSKLRPIAGTSRHRTRSRQSKNDTATPDSSSLISRFLITRKFPKLGRIGRFASRFEMGGVWEIWGREAGVAGEMMTWRGVGNVRGDCDVAVVFDWTVDVGFVSIFRFWEQLTHQPYPAKHPSFTSTSQPTPT